MSQHTKAPWPYFSDICEPCSYHPDSDGFVRMDFNDYYRARVCVNALEGLTTEQIEDGVFQKMREDRDFLAAEVDALTKQRDELLSQRNSTGVAIDNAMRGILPDEHPMINRLQMIANVAEQREKFICALNQIAEPQPHAYYDESNQELIIYAHNFNPFKIARDAIALQEAEDKS